MLRTISHVALTLLLLSGLVIGGPLDTCADGPDPTYGNLLRQGHQMLKQAQRAYLQGDTKEQHGYAARAEQFFLQAARLPERDLRAFLLGGQAAAFKGNLQAGQRWIALYRRATPYGEKDPDLAYLRAFVGYFGGGSPDVAINNLKRMFALNARVRPLERDTLWYSALMDRAAAHIVRGANHLAVQDYREAARLSKMHRWEAKRQAALGSAGIALRIATRYTEAHEVFKALLETNPKSPLWHWQQGMVYAEEHRFQEAIEAYRRVIRLRQQDRVDPTTLASTAAAHLRLANCIRNITRPDLPAKRRDAMLQEAQRNLEAYVKLVPEDANGHKWLGTYWYDDRDQPHKAIPHFEKARELDPMCSPPLRSLVQIYTRHRPEREAGQSDADYEQAVAAWEARRDTYAKELEEGAEERAAEMRRREARNGKDNTNCE